jgi:hypothetical protein
VGQATREGFSLRVVPDSESDAAAQYQNLVPDIANSILEGPVFVSPSGERSAKASGLERWFAENVW